ncbi:hypothetical protein KC19_10G114400 [Ceratodon purpureus]|uniref:Uncharacterized protein n=1 Tax=Ceratodon purpureus TaxID=3225 RepID=A0A8T0GMW0_CERPU|nr:hypothetical protein KC19_10G114400 [Ceratodon purpureus]
MAKQKKNKPGFTQLGHHENDSSTQHSHHQTIIHMHTPQQSLPYVVHKPHRLGICSPTVDPPTSQATIFNVVAMELTKLSCHDFLKKMMMMMMMMMCCQLICALVMSI